MSDAKKKKKVSKKDESLLQVGVEPTTFAFLWKIHIRRLPVEYKNDTLTTLHTKLAYDFLTSSDDWTYASLEFGMFDVFVSHFRLFEFITTTYFCAKTARMW